MNINFSCDDTAVAIVDSKRTLISSRKVSDWLSTNKLGGITPLGSAMHVRIVRYIHDIHVSKD